MNIANQGKQIAFGFYQNRFVAPAKQGAVAFVAPVESLRVNTVYMPHAARNIGIRGLNQQMIMVWHQAVGCNAEIPLFTCVNQNVDKSNIIVSISENAFASSATVQDVIPCVGIFYS